MKIEVNTRYSKDMITQSNQLVGEEYYLPSLSNESRRLTERVMHLREQGVRDALKKLGYLSPEEAEDLYKILSDLCIAYRTRTGLDGAWDQELLQAQAVVDKFKGGPR